MWAILAAILSLLADQALKLIVIDIIGLSTGERFDILPPYLVLRLIWNHGINFGVLEAYGGDLRWPLIGFAAAIAIWMLRWGSRQNSRVTQLSAGILAGGALANALDRVIHGAVADVLNMSCCGIFNPYVFNLADVWVFAGVIGLLAVSCRDRQS